MNTSEYWDSRKRTKRICRHKRRLSFDKHLSAISAFCAANGITAELREHGWQFRYREYVVNWCPATNRVQVQHALPGHGQTIPFTKLGLPNKPRIMVALEELVGLVRREVNPTQT